ncbi:hypothetical protein [Bradyrhizobium jicamae]|nr:hypothetical protein [Bradyrhizobium jicamae]
MGIAGSRTFSFALVSAMGLAVALLPTSSEAYTDEEQQACTPDAFRLCGPEIPDVDRITACMIRNKAQLSPACRAFFRSPEREDVAERSVRRPAATHRKPHKPKKPVKPAAS